jgi:Co/Zn/Cd efflux system component
VWNINLQRTVLTAHLEVTPTAFTGETLNNVQNTLKQRFGLSHVTLQLELP